MTSNSHCETWQLKQVLKKYSDRTLISWDDLFGKVKSTIPLDVVLMVWRPRWKKEVAKMLKRGYDMIITAPFYVDRTYEPLTDRYFANLWPQPEKRQQISEDLMRKHIIGGEACLWSEKVDASVLDAKLWPDAAATAENLWMGPIKIQSLIPLWDYVVKPRLKWYRCFMIERGIGFSPIDGNRTYPNDEYYLREPMYPFSCMDEEDIRPIEQRLPDNDTRAARREARAKRREERKQQLQERQGRRTISEYIEADSLPLYIQDGVDKTKRRVTIFKWAIALLFCGLLLIFVIVHCLGVNHAASDLKNKNW